VGCLRAEEVVRSPESGLVRQSSKSVCLSL
jgi:hypothetical protein